MAFAELFDFGQQCFKDLVAELAEYDITVEPTTQLVAAEGPLCYYNLQDRNIYLSVPDPDKPTGKLMILFLRSLLSCKSDDDLLRFFKVFIPWAVAHELAHHLRHKYGQFGTYLWHEEQIANQFAMAVTKRRRSKAEKEDAEQLLQAAVDGLVAEMKSANVAAESHYDIFHALNASGQINREALLKLQMIQQLFPIDPVELLANSGRLPEAILERLNQRQSIIDSINSQYASDIVKYFYYHLGWMYLDLISSEIHYIDEFARVHLHLRDELLPPIPAFDTASDENMLACFTAYQKTREASVTASRYFYKRYRSLLIARLAASQPPSASRRRIEKASFLFENWRDEDSEILNYMVNLAPTELRTLFPQSIRGRVGELDDVERNLPSTTDREIWRAVALGIPPEAARNTLERLELLDRTVIYQDLPAEVLIALTQDLCRVKLARDEVLVRQGEMSTDVYILISGKLGVFVEPTTSADSNGAGNNHRVPGVQPQFVSAIDPGQVIGEVSFFTGQARSATVQALEKSECFVLKAMDLRILCQEHPAVLMQMASTLAVRLVNVNASLVGETLETRA
jgi:CRP-like cAMP-binding protein